MVFNRNCSQIIKHLEVFTKSKQRLDQSHLSAFCHNIKIQRINVTAILNHGREDTFIEKNREPL